MTSSNERPESTWLRDKCKPLLTLCKPNGPRRGGLNEFCRKYGIQPASLSYFLAGKRSQITFWVGVRLATHLGVDLSELQKKLRE